MSFTKGLTQEHIDEYQKNMAHILAVLEGDPTLFKDLPDICNRERWLEDAKQAVEVLSKMVPGETPTKEQVGVLLKSRMLPIAFNMMFNSHQNSKPPFWEMN